MKTLLIIGIKLLGLWMVFYAILSGGFQELANTSIDELFDVRLVRTVELILPPLFGLALIFRTSWVIRGIGCNDIRDDRPSFSLPDGLKAGIILIGLDQLLSRIPMILFALTDSYLGITGFFQYIDRCPGRLYDIPIRHNRADYPTG